MRQPIFVIGGAVIVLILLLAWAYLLFFGTPETADDVFAELGLNGEEDTNFVPPPVVIEEDESDTVNMQRPKLRQLTTKQVAGFREIDVPFGVVPSLYYVEMGTGHIFSINLGDGEEKRISGTTVPQAKQASISSTGDVVAIASPTNSKNMTLVVGSLSTTSDLSLGDFSRTVQDFSIGSSSEVLYTVASEQNLLAYAYDPKTTGTKTLFTVPFREARVEWGSTSFDSHFVFPKASYALEGFLYEAKGGELTRMPVNGFGFSAAANSDMVLYNKTVNQKLQSNLYIRSTGENKVLNAAVLPEKCFIPTSGSIFVCAHEPIATPYEFPDIWYRGELSFKDTLYAISAESLTSEVMVDTFKESSRAIDVTHLKSGNSNIALYFINKNDNTLWMYEY